MRQADHHVAWTVRDIPDQSGRTAVVTGANGGLGFETAVALAGAGAKVIVAARNADKGHAAVARIRLASPRADVLFEVLDLASLASVADFANRMANRDQPIDLLVNNAGVASPPRRKTTADGFELQFGTNYLGHFALTARLLPSLQRSASPRVVTLSSVMHKVGRIDFDDLQWEQRQYSAVKSYSDSKLANLLFAFELQRRSDQAGWSLLSAAAHPGMARTDLTANGPGLDSLGGRIFKIAVQPFFTQSAADGALPSLFAATSPKAMAGGYYGPSRLFELVGPPTAAKVAKRARDLEISKRLWDVSETLAGVSFDMAGQSSNAEFAYEPPFVMHKTVV